MLLLAATEGTEIEIECVGRDEEESLARLLQLVVSKFDEE
jgi:phosphotransferase system HPr-like phosphotransfer protein